ncbi:MAG: AI-2E family transporter [Clostridia bacterium]|nr:AI-2E family transporter [Clostridia bacterium]
MKDISWAACLRLGVTAAAVWFICAGGMAALLHALTPLLLGMGLALVVDVPMAALERRFFPGGGRVARLCCLMLSLAGVLALLVWMALAMLPQVLQCLTLLSTRLQAAGLPQWSALAERVMQLALDNASAWLSTAAGALGSLARLAVDALLGLILAVYLLTGKERIAAQLTRLTRRTLGEAWLRRGTAALSALRDAFRASLVGQCLEALILGCLCLIGMVLLRLPGALPISAMAGLTAFVPLVGAPLAAGVGALLLLPEGIPAAMTFVVFFLAIQQLESGFIGPRVVGAGLGLSPLWTLLAVLLGGCVFGIPGALFAAPVAAAARTLLLKENEP